MTLLHPGQPRSVPVVEPCSFCVPGEKGPTCRTHNQQIAAAAYAQAQPGYGLPHNCGVCGELHIGDDARHEHGRQADDDRHKRLADI